MPQYTIQSAQANIRSILNEMDAGTLTSVELVKANGASVVAKILPYATYKAADVAGSAELVNIPQTLMDSGPMNPASGGLYKMTKVTVDAAAIKDATVKAKLTSYRNGADGVDLTAVKGGTAGNSITLTVVNPGVLTASTTVAVVGNDITVTLKHNGTSITATMQEVADALAASSAASALVTAAVVGAGATLAVAMAQTALSGGSLQPAGTEKFQAFGIYRKRKHSRNELVAPTLTPRAVIVSKTHADWLGL